MRCRIIDRLEQPLPYCRAIGITPRTLEVWDDMGIAMAMIDAGLWIEGFRSIIHGHPPNDFSMDFSGLPYAELGLPRPTTSCPVDRACWICAGRRSFASACGLPNIIDPAASSLPAMRRISIRRQADKA